MTQKTRKQAGDMGKRLNAGQGSVTSKADTKRALWCDVLFYYAHTGNMPGLCDFDETAGQAWAWIVGEASPLAEYE